MLPTFGCEAKQGGSLVDLAKSDDKCRVQVLLGESLWGARDGERSLSAWQSPCGVLLPEISGLPRSE